MGITPAHFGNPYLLIQPNLQSLAGDSPVVGVSLPRTTDTLIGFQSLDQWAHSLHNIRPTTIVTPRVPRPALRVEGVRESYLKSVLNLRPLSKLSFDPKVNYASEFINIYRLNKELLKCYERAREDCKGLQAAIKYTELTIDQLNKTRQVEESKRSPQEDTESYSSSNSYQPRTDNKSSETGRRYRTGRKRHLRRCANEIQKTYTCPFSFCGKHYGSEGSLNLHLRLKHNAGSKTEREKVAKQVIWALKSGQEFPLIDHRINLPPGTIEKAAQELGLTPFPLAP